MWSENKTGADYQPNQLPDYADALAEFPEAHQLITVVDRLSEVPVDRLHPDAPRWRGFTWRDVAVMAWKAGRDAATRDERPVWQEAARRPNSPASPRILLELLNYLEEEHGVVLNPLGYENVAAFAHMTDTGTILEELLKRAAELAHADIDGGVKWSNDAAWLTQSFSSTGTWAEPLGGAPKLHVADDDRWSRSRIGEPALGAGHSLPKGPADALLLDAKGPWRNAIETKGFFVSVFDGWVRVWRTKYLAEQIPAGVTLDTQAHEVTQWLDESFAILASNDPSVTP